jgi:hypothetical protein
MKSTDQNPLSVERLLSDVQFTPSPEFRERLYNRLKQQLSMTNLEQISESRQKRNGSLNGQDLRNRQWIMVFIAALCLVFIMATAMVPTVRAQVLSVLQFFEVQLSSERQSMVASSFTPFIPEEIPTRFPHFFSLNQQNGGSEYVELRYFSQDSFVVIYEIGAYSGETLPPGEPVQIGDHQAILNRELNGIVFLGAPEPQPWRAIANGGGGGNFDDAIGEPPQRLFYDEALKLTWIQSGLHIELLTNLTKDDALRLAASLQPAVQP